MPINTRTEYALRALLEMVDHEEAISAREICQRQNLPKKYVEHLLSGLKAAGIVRSSSGALGGYQLGKEPEQINLQDIMDAVGDDSFDPACHGGRDAYCLGGRCGLDSSLERLASDISSVLRSYNLKDIHSHFKLPPKEKK